MPRPTATPEIETTHRDKLTPLYHVVLLDDDDHTYEYVIEMLGKIFLLPTEVAFRLAVEVDTTGRTIVMTIVRPVVSTSTARRNATSVGSRNILPSISITYS